VWSPGPIGAVWSAVAALSLSAAVAVSVALGDGAVVAFWVGADVGAFVGGALLWVGATYGALVELLDPLPEPWLVGCDDGEDWWLTDDVWWPPELEPPLLCSVVGLWVGLWVGLVDGFCVGWAGGGAEVGGGAGGWVGCCTGVGVLWVGAAAAGDSSAGPPDPAALCGHHAIRHAATPSNAATAKRTPLVQVLLTSSSLTP
jgi:hypothetical protein